LAVFSCALAFLVAAGGGTAHAAKGGGLDLGIWDQVFLSGDGQERAQWLDRAVGEGANQVTIRAIWRGIAQSRPGDPTDPADPAYDWTELDAAIRDASSRGLSIMLMIYQAPDWAEGPNRDPDAAPGSWRPNPNLLGQFAGAIATRYSGEFTDPLSPGASLPRVSLYQVWGEPNLWLHLNPQWVRSGGKWRAASPSHYRRMVNAAYAAVEAVDPANRVIAGGLAPAGDYKRGSRRIEPLLFWREFFCLRNRNKLKPKKCGGKKPHLDVLGGNPLSGFVTGNPFKGAVQPDDTWPPDMDELTRIIRAARKHRRVAPRRGTEVWATELLAFTNPPNARYGLSDAGQASYLADALFVLWRQGVSNVTWVGLNDGDGYGSGLFRDDGTPKPSAHAFRFPFVARSKKGKGGVRVWGKSPSGGPVEIEREVAGGFETIDKLGTKAGGIFSGRVDAPRSARLRATVGDVHSLTR
jgi:hypothetical protein